MNWRTVVSRNSKIKWAYLSVFLLLTGCSLFPKEEEVLAPPLVEPSPIKYAILAWEQLLTFGVAFAMGMTAGKLANSLFLPALSLYLHADKQVPPFTVISMPQDEQIIYTFIAVTLVIGIGVVGILLSRMQIHQAVKLGED
ncbi:hypothetical protein [Brevibacillus brevis]|uniref:hypothetical protein n=1 Tax=Brevibacillus brevis TaxID=1393 RepID=UPI001EE21BF5|nr:hypothetical protein [Brevibacillus brevis]